MMSRGAVLGPVLERFGSEEWKFRGPKNEQKSDIFGKCLVLGHDSERFGSEVWKLRGPKLVPTSSGASGHLPCGCNLVI